MAHVKDLKVENQAKQTKDNTLRCITAKNGFVVGGTFMLPVRSLAPPLTCTSSFLQNNLMGVKGLHAQNSKPVIWSTVSFYLGMLKPRDRNALA